MKWLFIIDTLLFYFVYGRTSAWESRCPFGGNCLTKNKNRDMELEGRISVVMPAQSGVSKNTGNPWMSQEYVLAYYWFPNQTNPSYIVMRAFGEDRIKQFNLQPNDEVKVRFHAEAHESNGRWFNELRIDGVTFVAASAGKNQQTGQISGKTAVNEPQQAAVGDMGTVKQAVVNQATLTDDQKAAMEKLNGIGEGGGDLPF